MFLCQFNLAPYLCDTCFTLGRTKVKSNLIVRIFIPKKLRTICAMWLNMFPTSVYDSEIVCYFGHFPSSWVLSNTAFRKLNLKRPFFMSDWQILSKGPDWVGTCSFSHLMKETGSIFHWAVYCDVCDLHSEGSYIDSRSGHWLSCFNVFLNRFIQMTRRIHWIGHDQFIPNALQFILYQSYHSTLYNLKIWREKFL
jgi:hypothetical protein